MLRGTLLVLDTCTVDLDRLRVFHGGRPGAALSAREASLLRALAAVRGEPVDRPALAQATGAAQPRAVDHAVRRLREKLEADPRSPVHLVTVHGIGYALHGRRVQQDTSSAPEARWLRLSACKVDLASRLVVSATGTTHLSPMEAALLQHLAARPNQPIERDDLLARVWGYRGGRTNTLATTLRRLRRKVCRDPSRPANLVTRGHATMFVPPAAEALRRGTGYVVRRWPADLAVLQQRTPDSAQQALQRVAQALQALLDDDDVLTVDADGVSVWCERHQVAAAAAEGGNVVVCHGDVAWLPGAERLAGAAAERARALAEHVPPGARWVEASVPHLGGAATAVVPLPRLGAVVPVVGSVADPLLGRSRLLDEVTSLLEPGALVTLVGPAGVGKTRMAHAIAPDALHLELAPLRSLDAVLKAVEHALGAAFDPQLDRDGRLRAIGNALSHRTEASVVLDNAEHLLPIVTQALSTWRDTAPRIRWLVTSRVALQVPNERVVTVPPLAHDDALLLLGHHAGLVHRPWTPPEGAALHALAERLDALPLALVLAGRVVRRLGPVAAAGRVATGLELRGDTDRHATLHATLGITWALLSDAGRQAAGTLSAYAGAVPQRFLDGLDPTALRELLAHHLIVPASGGVRMLVAVSAFVAGRAGPDAVAVHARRVVADAERLSAGVHRHGGADALRSLHGIAAELDAVVDRAWSGRVDRSLGARALLARFPLHQWTGGAEAAARYEAWAERDLPEAPSLWLRAGELLGRAGQGPAGLEAFARGLTLTDDEGLRGQLLAERGRVTATGGDLDAAEADYLEAIALLDATGQEELAGRVLGNLGLLRWWQARPDEASARYEDALHRLRSHGSMAFEAVVLGNRTTLDVDAKRYPEAIAGYERSLALHRAMGNVMFEGVVSSNLGSVWEHLGDATQARAAFEEAIRLNRLCGDRLGEGISLVNLAQFVLDDDVQDARDILDSAAAILLEGPHLYSAIGSGAASVPHHWLGDLPSAQRHLEHALARLEELGHAYVHRYVLARAACVWADAGDVDRARAFLLRAEDVDSDEPRGVLEAARAHVVRAEGGDPTLHVEALRAIVPSAERDARIALQIFEG